MTSLARPSYSDLLKDPLWQKKRLEILSRDKFTCRGCESTEKTLHVHHRYYIKGRKPWQYPNWAFITFCRDCHEQVDEIQGSTEMPFESLVSAIRILHKRDPKFAERILRAAKTMEQAEAFAETNGMGLREFSPQELYESLFSECPLE